MIRILLALCALSVSPLLAESQAVAAPEKAPSAQNSQTRVAPPGITTPVPAPIQPPTPIATDAPVVTIQGICPLSQPPLGQKSDSCTLVLTRGQFEAMVTAINVTNQNYTMPALRSLATGYVTVIALADAAEKEGIEKDPRFQELLKVARARSLADAYRRFLHEKYGNPSSEAIEEYYKRNLARFEQLKVDRILIPKVNPKRSQDKPAEFEKKARQLAEAVRERAAKGEDMNSLQAEVYKALAIDLQPPPTEVAANRKGTFLPAVEAEINSLKPGETTKVETEPSGFYIYKLRSRNTLPLEHARIQIITELSQQNIDAALKAVTGKVHSELNDQYFNPRTPGASQPVRLPASMAPRGSVPRELTDPALGKSSNAAPQTPASPK